MRYYKVQKLTLAQRRWATRHAHCQVRLHMKTGNQLLVANARTDAPVEIFHSATYALN